MIRTIGPRDGGLQAFSVAIPLGSAVGERDGFRCDAGEKATQGRRGCSGRAGADDPRCLRASERAADAVGAFAAQRTLQEHGFAPPGVAAQVQLRLSYWRRPLRSEEQKSALQYIMPIS